MIIKDIDKGKDFDWGKTSKDYAKYRDIYHFKSGTLQGWTEGSGYWNRNRRSSEKYV